MIADAAALEWRGGRLGHAGQQIDLVYIGWSIFIRSAFACGAARGYMAGAVVLTPHPHAHALYADKRNLVLLSDPAQLAQLGWLPRSVPI